MKHAMCGLDSLVSTGHSAEFGVALGAYRAGEWGRAKAILSRADSVDDLVSAQPRVCVAMVRERTLSEE